MGRKRARKKISSGEQRTLAKEPVSKPGAEGSPEKDEKKAFLSGRFENIFRVIIAVIISIFVFSSLSYNLSIPVYLFVPATAAFMMTFVLPKEKFWLIVPLILAPAGAVLYSQAPPLPGGLDTPAKVMESIINERQTLFLTYTPPIILGVLGALLGWGIASEARRSKKRASIVAWILFILFCINFVAVSLDLNPQSAIKASEEPDSWKYNNFNSVNLKTFYMMERGMGFYESYLNSYLMRADSGGTPPGNFWNWTLPFLFHMWNWLLPSDGFYILYFYLLFSIGMFYLIFDLSAAYLSRPLNLIPVFLVSYLYVFGAAAFWFTFPVYWGSFFVILGIWGIYKKHPVVAAAGFTMAALSTYLFLPVIIAISIISLFSKDRKFAFYMLIPPILSAVMFVLHYIKIMTMQRNAAVGIGEWLHGGIREIPESYFFGSSMLSISSITLNAVLILALFAIYRLIKDLPGRSLLISAYLPLPLFLQIGSGTLRDYWGIAYMPFILITACYAYPMNNLFLKIDELKTPAAAEPEALPESVPADIPEDIIMRNPIYSPYFQQENIQDLT